MKIERDGEKTPGLLIIRGFMTRDAQAALIGDVRRVVAQCPLFRPVMKDGKQFRYRMTNCGEIGWISDRRGYYYSKSDPRTGRRWPEMPSSISEAAHAAAGMAGASDFKAETCLVNLYKTDRETLGIHQDNTEKNLAAPIISLSLGDDGIFALGGLRRSDPVTNIILSSGDCLIMGGPARMRFHAFKSILPGTSTLLRNGGRINLTIRQVN